MIFFKVLEENNVIKEEVIFKKSKFVTYITKIKNKEELKNFINEYKKLNADHNCYAFKFGINDANYGYNNDGEPAGTAGEPLLKIIELNNLTNIAILVVRYFGGIKLGIGGLQKAYSASTIKIIKNSSLRELEFLFSIDIKFSISDIKFINSFLNNLKVKDPLYRYFDNEVFLSFKISNVQLLNPILNKIKILKEDGDYF